MVPFEGGSATRVQVREPADFQRALASARRSIPDGFRLVARPPFILIGDYSEEHLRTRLDKVVWPIATAYWTQFMSQRPTDTIRIYLFSTTEGYEKEVTRILGRRPISQLGLYSLTSRTLFANGTVGYGWMSHELWHALVDYDFRLIPRWLDEGMASLFEKPRIVNGRMHGEHNWRLWILHEYTSAGRFVPLKDLVERTGISFYDQPERPMHYAEARYLCFYLQEQGQLARFYQRLRERIHTDPTGAQTLLDVTGASDLAHLESRWRRWLEELPRDAGR